MKTIKEVLENQESTRKEIYKLLAEGKSDYVLQIISELGYQIRTENQAPLDNTEEFDNEAHELAVFLQGVIADAERKLDISKTSVARVISSAKNAVREITKDVLRTAEIRRSLSEYDIALYRENLEKGIKEAEDELAKTQAEYEKMNEIRTEIFGDPAIMDDDSLSDEQKYTKIRDNLEQVAKKYAAYIPFEHLANVDFSTMDPSTEEGRKKIEEAYKPFMKVFADIDRRRANAENNIANFTLEIETIDKERAILGKDITDKEAYRKGIDSDAIKAEVEDRKAKAHQDNVDKFRGNDEKARQYREKFLKFRSHIKEADLQYKDRNGRIVTVRGKTLESYPGMEADLEFLQLPTYKERIERISMYSATKDLYAYNPELARRLDSATTDAERKAIKEEIKIQFNLDRDYVRTFHGAQNRTRMQYESYMNAGSALKSMVPLKTADTFGGKLAIAAQNVGRYTGLKIPRFTRIDENGNKVRDIKSGLVALGGDAIIIGGTIAFPAAMGLAYGAKTIGVLGMRAYGRFYKHKHKDEMDIPTPYTQTAGARRAARESKYKEDGHSAIGSWARAVLDNVRPAHRKAVEQEIIDKRNEEIDKSIEDQYIKGAIKQDAREREIAEENEIIRKRLHDQVRRSGEVYNDIYRDPDSAVKRTVDLRVSEATALGLGGEDISDPSRISFTDSRDPRSTNFAKAKLSVVAKVKRAIRDDTVYGERIGETVWTSSIENKDVAKSITRTTDVKRRIVTVLAGLGLRGIGKAINDQKTVEYETKEGTGRYEKVKVGEHQEQGDIIGYNQKTVTRPSGIDDVSLGDLERQGDASWGAFNSGPNYASGYHPDVAFRAGDDTIQGIALKFPDPVTGKTVRFSISSSDIGDIVHNNPNLHEFTQVYSDGHLGLSPTTKLSEIKDFITDPSVRQAYDSYLAQYSQADQVDKMLDTLEFAWGRSESVIGRGWTSSEVLDRAREVVEQVIDYSDPIYGEMKIVDDYALQEIMQTVMKTKEITDPTLHALKDAFEKAGLATALQQLGEATAETAQPVAEREKSGRPYVGLDSAEDVNRQRKPFVYKPKTRSSDDEGR